MYSNFSTKVTIFDRFAKLYGTYLARNKNFFLSLQIEQIRRLVTKQKTKKKRGEGKIMIFLAKTWQLQLSVVAAVVVFWLCLVPYRAIMNYHEQTHLFRWTWTYLQEQAATPNGWMEYAASFVTQFFYVGWLGAVIMALLAVGVQALTWAFMRAVRMNRPWLYPATLIPPALLFYYVFIPQAYKTDPQFRETIEYDYLLRAQKWDAIVAKSYYRQPETLMGIWCTNRALAQRNELLDKMFHYRQEGPDGLLMDAARMNPLTLYSLSDICFDLGLINSAERFAFDAKQLLPDNHKSGRIYRRLAEANMVNGHYAVAKKYLHILQSTLFYGRWADKTLHLLGDEERINADARYGWLRACQQKENDQLAYAKEQMLAELVKTNPKNRLAADYLLAYEMLRLDLEGVLTNTLMVRQLGYERTPKAVQECIAGYAIMMHPNDSLPIPIDQEVFHTTFAYLQTVNNTGNRLHPSLDAEPFNRSYWHYHSRATTKIRQQKQQ